MRDEIILLEAKDNWPHLTYEQRYLDGLAAILNVQTKSKCAAVTYLPKQNKFLLSYNENCTPTTLNKIKEVIELINDSTTEGQKSLYPKVKLLARYLTFNSEFALTLQYSLQYNWYPTKEIGGLIQELEQVITSTRRVLDTKCYNTEEIRKSFKTSMLKFLGLLPQDEPLIAIDRIQVECNDICNNIKKPIENKQEIYNKVLKSYYQLFEALQEYQSTTDIALTQVAEIMELKKIILRPWQDIKKVTYCLKENWPTQLPEFEILLTNPNKIHAEIHLAYSQNFITEDLNLSIGVSRLCCIPCDIIFLKKGLPHRGCHGIIFPWQHPSDEYQHLAQELRQQNQDQREEIGSQLMHRRLSTDDFEKLQLKGFWKLKESLGLVEEIHHMETSLSEDTPALDLVGKEDVQSGGSAT